LLKQKRKNALVKRINVKEKKSLRRFMRQSFTSARIKKIIARENSKTLIAETENKKQIAF